MDCFGTYFTHVQTCNVTVSKVLEIALEDLCYWQLYGACERGRRVVNLYDLSLAISRNFGKPPPESYSRIASTSFFEDVS